MALKRPFFRHVVLSDMLGRLNLTVASITAIVEIGQDGG